MGPAPLRARRDADGRGGLTVADPPEGFTGLEDTGGHLAVVGPVLCREAPDGPVLALRVEDRHLNRAGTAHGGVLATLMDSAMGRAVRSAHDDEIGAVTVSLTTDYLKPVAAGAWVEARTEVERLGGRLAFVDCSLTADGEEVVRGRAVFAVLD
jgi:uncharacterized protein (TIGR00369 family)